MSTQHPQMSDADEQALRALQAQLLAVIQAQDNHRLVLTALLSVYAAVAASHPCCTQGAGRAALRVGGDLLAGTTPYGPRGAAVH